MNKQQAIDKATRAARQFRRPFHVMVDRLEGFVIADDNDLEAWPGSDDPLVPNDPQVTVQPDGEVTEQ